MSRQMAGEDNVLRTKILKEVNEDFHQGDKLNFAMDSEILLELVRCFEEEDEVIRELGSRAIIKVAGTEKGRIILKALPVQIKINIFMQRRVVECFVAIVAVIQKSGKE